MRSRQALAALAIAVLGACAAPEIALPHAGNPNYESIVDGIVPDAPGVEVEVLNYDDSLRLRNDGAGTVVIRGYEGEPYARIRGDGLVEVNTRSPTYYLNRDRFARAEVPPAADAGAAPRWRRLDESGQLVWHDHRAHYMGMGTPPQVSDESKRTKVFAYRVPISVDGRRAAIVGDLYWVGKDNGFPVLPFALLAVVTLAGAGLIAVRHFRRRSGPDVEAW